MSEENSRFDFEEFDDIESFSVFNSEEIRDLEPGMGTQRAKDELDRRLVERWGGYKIVLSKGFTAVPNTFLMFAPRLGLTPSEILLVLVLMQHKWEQAAPYPSYERIASRLNVSAAQARKLARQLENKGMLLRVARDDLKKGRSSNAFDLDPLFRRLAFETLMADKAAGSRKGARSSPERLDD